MKPIVFTQELKTGNQIVDQDHRLMITWANHLFALDSNVDKAVVTKILTDLGLFVEKHFQNEELLMAQVDYPLADKMRIQHRRLLGEIDALFKQWESLQDIRGISVALHYLLVDWFFLHILEWDKPLAEFAKSQEQELDDLGE